MKRRKARAAGREALGVVFARGFVVTALLEAAQSRPHDGRRLLRRALQGGAALAAGTSAAASLGRRDYLPALAAVAVGAATIAAAEILTDPTLFASQETERGPQDQEVEEAAAPAEGV
ncbi:hypothetical protein [Pinisolibacter sp.]|uniref:hypothetical protein n=1 Tax=Pinisolibacter sp. TaxID=2172024 RepID=UPI002FDCBFC7